MDWLGKYFSAVVRYLGSNLPMRGILEFVGDGVTAEDTTADDGTPVTRVTIEAPPLPPIPPAPNGGFGQLLVSNGAGGYSTAITPPGSLVGTQVTQTLSNGNAAVRGHERAHLLGRRRGRDDITGAEDGGVVHGEG